MQEVGVVAVVHERQNDTASETGYGSMFGPSQDPEETRVIT